MPAWGWAAIVWAISIPVALWFARRQGFIVGDEPIVLFRVPIVCFVAPAVALVALLASLGDAVAPRRRGDR
jgi:hypothetical protein